MKVKTMAEMAGASEEPEVLFWVGCAGSYDARAQKVTRTFCEILNKAGVSFAILGNEETCTGDPARRAGNEFLFQMLALQNIEVLNMYKVKKIVTACPHCFNTLKNEYPALGGNYEVVHHSQYLEELIQTGKIKVDESKSTTPITIHDSCYLGRANDIYAAPRNVLEAFKMDIKELKRNKQNGLCCGAGGAQVFKEDEPGDKRINVERSEEIIASGRNKVAVNCPFCMIMLEDGLKAKEKNKDVMVLDLTELIIDQMA